VRWCRAYEATCRWSSNPVNETNRRQTVSREMPSLSIVRSFTKKVRLQARDWYAGQRPIDYSVKIDSISAAERVLRQHEALSKITPPIEKVPPIAALPTGLASTLMCYRCATPGHATADCPIYDREAKLVHKIIEAKRREKIPLTVASMALDADEDEEGQEQTDEEADDVVHPNLEMYT